MKRKTHRSHRLLPALLLVLTLLLSGAVLTACTGSSGNNSTDSDSAGSGSADSSSSGNNGADNSAPADGGVGTATGSEDGAAEDSDGAANGSAADDTDAVYPTGSFTMEDISGTAYTEAMFADYDLTLVNVFASWCSPCIAELPDLEQLSRDVADSGVQVVGIVLDAADGEGGADPEALEAAQLLAEDAGVTYPFLIPDAEMMNGLLTGIQSIPTTFFVNREGNLVGNVYVGSRSLEDWTAIVESELEALGGA